MGENSMFVSHVKQTRSINVGSPGATGVIKQILVGPEQGWDGWVMRLFEVSPGGSTPRHSHDWPHINYVIGGQGTLFLDGEEHSIEQESIAYVPAGREHQFLNRGTVPLRFICIVPEEGDK